MLSYSVVFIKKRYLLSMFIEETFLKLCKPMPLKFLQNFRNVQNSYPKEQPERARRAAFIMFG